jgi:integrase
MKIKLRDGSGAREYRYVWQDVDRHGNLRIYLARTGRPKIRLLEEPGSEAFDREYRRAFQGVATPPPIRQAAAPQTLQWLCERYYASADFQLLGPTTRKVRRGILETICQSRFSGKLTGTLPYARMRPHNVAQLRDAKLDLPEAANARVKALRQLFKWAMSPAYSLAERNPAMEVGYLRSNNPEGFRAWTAADVEKYAAHHPIGTKARLALDLMLYTGVRRSDVVRLGPQMERDGYLVFTETKGRAHLSKQH